MYLTPKIQKAINMAAEKHLDQKRKADALPYIVHPFSVAWILINYTTDEDVICAGLMHDVLEDVAGYGFEDLKRDFGKKIAGMVKEVSEDKNPAFETDEKKTWQERKEKYLANLKKASPEALLVCGADKIHNLHSMADAYLMQGNAMWKKFNSPAEKKLWFYEEVLKILKDRSDSVIVGDLATALKETEKTLKLPVREETQNNPVPTI